MLLFCTPWVRAMLSSQNLTVKGWVRACSQPEPTSRRAAVPAYLTSRRNERNSPCKRAEQDLVPKTAAQVRTELPPGGAHSGDQDDSGP
jgi:hypothetical protein